MQEAASDGAIVVNVGETFKVERMTHESSGYRIDVHVPEGITRIGRERTQGQGIGGSGGITECFRCVRPGEFEISFKEGRPWELASAPAVKITVRCKER
jgi:predicted secreted protein